jgi:hypothetical protein
MDIDRIFDCLDVAYAEDDAAERRRLRLEAEAKIRGV